MSLWRVARSLRVLADEVNAMWPARNKESDGFIGDTAHAASASDHNPNGDGVVCAFDITHDPNGPDGNDLAERLRLRHHPDAKYIIWNHRICSAYERNGVGAWEWRPYGGADPHTNHVHVSVGVGPDGQSQPPYDDPDPWLEPVPPESQQPEEPDMCNVIHNNNEYLLHAGKLVYVTAALPSTIPSWTVDDGTWGNLTKAFGGPVQ